MAQIDASSANAPASTADNNKWWTLLAVCIGTFMLLLDVTIVNVALKSIQDDLHSSFSDLQWVVDAYALTLASFLLIFGSLADIFGRRRIFLAGIVLFSAASLSCGLANSPVVLNISRAFQGIGGAAMFATALALLAQEFRGKERGTAFGVWGAVTGAAVAIGPLVGGALTDGLGWQSIFYVNVPVGIIAFALTVIKVRDAHDGRPGVKVDYVGFVTFSVSLFLLIYALVRGNLDGWSSGPIVGSFIGAAALMAVFLVSQKMQKHPMLDLALFKRPTFIGASAAALTLSGSIFALFLYITLYFQEVLGYKPFDTGLRFLPTTMISFVVAAVAGKASAHLPVKWLMTIGLSLITIGLFAMRFLIHADSSWLAILVGLSFTGFGIGLTNPPLASTAVSVVPPERSGMASGINSTFRQMGIATGIAGLGAIFQHQLTEQVNSRLNGAFEKSDIAAIGQGITNGDVGSVLNKFPMQAETYAYSAVKHSFVHSFDYIAMVAGIISLVGAIVVLFTVRQKDFVHTPHEK
jgi:EmrB/QacA subfamily drug resistance transporter